MVLCLGNETLEKVSLLLLRVTLYLNQWVSINFFPQRKENKQLFGQSEIISRRKFRTKCSFKCHSNRCEVCLNVNETSIFDGTVTGETYIINHKFNCNYKCLVYLLTCSCCKQQYVGQTVDEFLFRWNNYKSNCRKHVCNNTYTTIFAEATIIVL